MSEPTLTIVTGPGFASSESTAMSMNPSRYVTNHTNKVQYRDALKPWEEIIRSLAKDDVKAKDWLDMMGLIIYLACDDEAKAKLRAEAMEKRLQLKGDDTDPDRATLVQKIISTIAQETPSEKIQREMKLVERYTSM